MDRKFAEERINVIKEYAQKNDIKAFYSLIEETMKDEALSKDIGLLIETGVSFVSLNKFSEGKEFFLKALDINPRDEYALKGLVKALFFLQDYDCTKKYIGYLLENFHAEKQYFMQFIQQAVELMYQYKNLNDYKNLEKILGILRHICGKTHDKKIENILINEIEIAQNKKRLTSMPRKLELLVTSKCNIRCKMCNIPRGEWMFPESRNSEILKLMPYLEEIIWHGGEPLLYPHIYDLIEEASRNNVRQTISTNGLLLDEKNIKKLLAANVELNVSIHGLDKKTYESIHINGDFDKLISNLSLIKKLMSESANKIKYGFKFLLMKNNYKQMPYIYNFVKQYGFNHVYINVLDEFTVSDEKILYYGKDRDILEKIIQMSDSLREKLKEINVFYEAWIPDINEPACNDEKNNDDVKIIKNKTGCYIPWKKMHVDMDGDVRNDCFCSNIVIGNIVKEDIENIWNGKRVLQVRENIINDGFDSACADGCINGRVPENYLKSVR